jgi:hypothetical protein
MSWWEVLRLWAALIEGKSPDNLAEVLRELLGSDAGYWLVGAVLADGLGEDVFEDWSSALATRLGGVPYSTTCAAAWKVCQQVERRRRVVAQLAVGVDRWTWMQRWRADLWRARIGVEVPLPKPPEGTAARWIMEAL